MEIRLLRAEEIECRVAMVKGGKNGSVGCSLLLYKDARCDMNILDEVFGPLGWERSHQLINGSLFCTVSVYDEAHSRWVCKQDVGTESNTEKEKGQASDSFKRACFNLGIGRELYTAPFIWITLGSNEYLTDGKENFGNPKYKTYAKFHVKAIGYTDKKITSLVIEDDYGKTRYALNAPDEVVSTPKNEPKEEYTQPPASAPGTPQSANNKKLTDKQLARLYAIAYKKGYSKENVINTGKKRFGVEDLHDLKKADYETMCKGYEAAEHK